MNNQIENFEKDLIKKSKDRIKETVQNLQNPSSTAKETKSPTEIKQYELIHQLTKRNNELRAEIGEQKTKLRLKDNRIMELVNSVSSMEKEIAKLRYENEKFQNYLEKLKSHWLIKFFI